MGGVAIDNNKGEAKCWLTLFLKASVAALGRKNDFGHAHMTHVVVRILLGN